MINETILMKRAEFFKDHKIAVHIPKKNNWFNNGLIKEIGEDYLILIDEKEGEVPIFFSEMFDVLKREEKQ